MPKKKTSYQIPFDPQGNQPHWTGWYHQDITYVDNFEFEDTLEFIAYESNMRSSGYFLFKRLSNGCTVSMFARHFNRIAKNMVHGQVAGNWTFVKRGQNFGIVPVGYEESTE